MDIYTKKLRWKLYLFLAAMLILAISTIYTNYITERLAEGIHNKLALWAQALDRLNTEEDMSVDVTFEHQVYESVKDIPVILVTETGKIYDSINFSPDADIEKELSKIQNGGLPPINGTGYSRYIYYKHPLLLTLLNYFPILQIVFFSIFAGISYLLFSSARKSEQNQVWAGMAKETAHQLGTPISGIIGWIDHLRMMYPQEEDLQEVLNELGNDVEKLNLIADRFSKIGSAPKLSSVNIYEQLETCKVYMQKRASRRMVFDFPNPNKTLLVKINPPLFVWVVENLIRNALDSMGGEGKISARVKEEEKFVLIEISDTGKGIAANKFKTIFEPGFTTKKRGWGLGLSLAKRIIETYHSGRIFVKSSDIGKGTTFAIKLPKG